MSKPITITIAPEDAAQCAAYKFGTTCLLATATKRQLGREDIKCGGHWVKIGDAQYGLSQADSDRVFNAYDDLVNAVVKEPFTVTLIP